MTGYSQAVWRPTTTRLSPVLSGPVAIELSDELIELERAAWAEQQETGLTVETAARVQEAITAHAEATEQSEAGREARRAGHRLTCAGSRTWVPRPALIGRGEFESRQAAS